MGANQSVHHLAKGRVFKLQRDEQRSEQSFWLFETKPEEKLPVEVDLSPMFPPVFDQGNLGSCTANAILASFQYEAKKEKCQDTENLSRLYEYYKARETMIPPNVKEDTGTSLAMSVYCLYEYGVCDEKYWPYDVTMFNQEPPKEAVENAKYHKCVEFKKVTQTHEQMRAGLAHGYSFVLGISVYSSMMTPTVGETGVVPMPVISDTVIDGKKVKADTLMGGHAVCCVGYNDQTKQYKIRNSWSDKWGDKGYFYLPYEFVENNEYTYDMWSIRMVKSQNAPVAGK